MAAVAKDNREQDAEVILDVVESRQWASVGEPAAKPGSRMGWHFSAHAGELQCDLKS